jgi:hypothetical protein
VDKVTVHYKLEYGKYRKDDTRLYVQEATRYLLNKHLEGLFKGSDAVKREKGEQNESADESDSLDPGEDDESKA